MQIKIAAPLGGDAIIEFDDNEEVSGRLSIISGDITEDMIAEAIAGANPNSYMGFVNTLDAPASDVLRNAASLRWLVCRLASSRGWR